MKYMEIVLLVVLIVLVVALFVISTLKKKKVNSEISQMRDELKAGDKVMTDAGIVGEVVESLEEALPDGTMLKYFVLKTGKGDKVSYFTAVATSIFYAYGKEEATAKENKVVVKVAPKDEKKEEKTENKEEKETNENK